MLWGCAACSSSKWISNESTCQFSQTNWRDGNPASNDKASCQWLSKFSAALPVVSVSKGSRLQDENLFWLGKSASLQFSKEQEEFVPKCVDLRTRRDWKCVFSKKAAALRLFACASHVCILLSWTTENIFSIFPFTTCFSCSRCAGISSRIPRLPSPCVKIDWNKNKKVVLSSTLS